MTDPYSAYKPHSLLYRAAKGVVHAFVDDELPESAKGEAESMADEGLDYVANLIHKRRLAEKAAQAKAAEARKGS